MLIKTVLYFARAHPAVHLGVIALCRINVNATQATRLIQRHDRIRKRAPHAKLGFVPAEIHHVFVQAHGWVWPIAFGAKNALQVVNAGHHGIVIFYAIFQGEFSKPVFVCLQHSGYVEVIRNQIAFVHEVLLRILTMINGNRAAFAQSL